jgi:hypothetical protein
LDEGQKLSFVELFAHELTICARWVWSENGLSESDQIQKMKAINEIQHRVISRIRSIRLKKDQWSEEDFVKMIIEWTAGDSGLLLLILNAAKSSLS